MESWDLYRVRVGINNALWSINNRLHIREGSVGEPEEPLSPLVIQDRAVYTMPGINPEAVEMMWDLLLEDDYLWQLVALWEPYLKHRDNPWGTIGEIAAYTSGVGADYFLLEAAYGRRPSGYVRAGEPTRDLAVVRRDLPVIPRSALSDEDDWRAGHGHWLDGEAYAADAIQVWMAYADEEDEVLAHPHIHMPTMGSNLRDLSTVAPQVLQGPASPPAPDASALIESLELEET